MGEGALLLAKSVDGKILGSPLNPVGDIVTAMRVVVAAELLGS